MLKQSDLHQVDVGSGYFIGEQKGTHPYLRYLKDGAIVCLFDGVDITLDFIADKLKKPKNGDSSEKTGRGGFNAFATYQEAMDIFRNKPEQVVKFDPAELRIKDESEAGSVVEYDVTGDFIDMGRYMEGIPESVGTMHRGNARNRRVSIVINITQAWNIDHGVITHRGERILRLIDALESGGIRTQLTAISSSDTHHVEVILKHHEEPLTISDLAIVTHPEFFRRPIFRIIEHSKTQTYNYGGALYFGESLKPEVIENGNNDEMDIVIDSNIRSISEVDSLFDKLEKLLVWEMSKPVPEVSSVKVDRGGIWFNPNGARAEAEIRREGLEAINAD